MEEEFKEVKSSISKTQIEKKQLQEKLSDLEKVGRECSVNVSD